jgi:lipid-A-disaccharide synthase
MCIIYKASQITFHVAMALIKVRFLGLCNLLANKMIVPEFLQYDCNAFELSRYIFYFQEHSDLHQEMIKQLSTLKDLLSDKQSDCSLFDLVAKELSLKKS